MMIRNRTFWIAAAAVVLPLVAVGCGGGDKKPSRSGASKKAASASAYKVDPAQAATLTGSVAFDNGGAPKPQRIRMDADPVCEHKHPQGAFAETVLVNDDGTMQNVFVYVKSGLEGKSFDVPSEPMVLDQDGCTYHPHVWGAQVGQTIQIRNSDPTLHNIHAKPKVNKEFNMAQPMKGMTSDRSFDKVEVMIPFKCDVHPWMSSYGGVLDHPYFAVTGEDGSFEIANLPPGDYVLEAWHEKYGTQTQSVTVGAKESKSVDFTFKSM